MQLRRLKLKTQGTEESSCMESNSETPTSPKPLQEKELFILRNKSVQYKVLEFIGEGNFGKVAKCVNMKTNENTAIKILKDVNDYDDEVEMLEELRTLDPEKNNLVRFMDSFIDDDKSCIALELLDRSLWDLMVQRKKPLTLNEIRPITRQLLVAFNALKGIGILYTDLKLDNVKLKKRPASKVVSLGMMLEDTLQGVNDKAGTCSRRWKWETYGDPEVQNTTELTSYGNG
uniref:Protein kinase domain-containing protein n=1 Tax=Gasterosteus aculeatus aculeatus TaxID=481459 RepID=A0AAQ4RTF5_GASAC